ARHTFSFQPLGEVTLLLEIQPRKRRSSSPVYDVDGLVLQRGQEGLRRLHGRQALSVGSRARLHTKHRGRRRPLEAEAPTHFSHGVCLGGPPFLVGGGAPTHFSHGFGLSEPTFLDGWGEPRSRRAIANFGGCKIQVSVAAVPA